MNKWKSFIYLFSNNELICCVKSEEKTFPDYCYGKPVAGSEDGRLKTDELLKLLRVA